MNTWWWILIGFAVITVGSMILMGIRRGRPRFAPRRGDQPTPTREGAAWEASPDASSEPQEPRTASERGAEHLERSRSRG